MSTPERETVGGAGPRRVVFHIDMNAYFASVEQAADPRLRGKPVAVVGRERRTVVLTASYEARAYGVKTGLQVPEALRLCPSLLLVPADNAKYTEICARLVRMYEEYTDTVEVASVDESYLDVTGTWKFWGGVEPMAREIQRRIRAEHGITCSVGIAPNKLLAKLASDLMKPSGLVHLSGDDPAGFVLEWLPVAEMCGIGPRLSIHLLRMGIRTLGDLARFPVAELVERFGKTGVALHRMARGLDESPVVDHRFAEEAKSIGHSMTLERDVEGREEMSRVLLRLSEMVGRRMRREGVRGRTVHVVVRHFDFQTFGRQKSYDSLFQEDGEIHRRACEVLDGLPTQVPVRLLGVSISGLTRVEEGAVFESDRRGRALLRALDRINDRYGKRTITYASLLSAQRHAGVISPSWRPEGTRHIPFA